MALRKDFSYKIGEIKNNHEVISIERKPIKNGRYFHDCAFLVCRCNGCGTTKTITIGSFNVSPHKCKICNPKSKPIKTKKIPTHSIFSIKKSYRAEFLCFRNMILRCYNEKHRYYKNYGGRGITVYSGWINSFELFLSHIGKRPAKKYSIDRINNDGNYEPGNVRWVTQREQANNRRSNIIITIQGETHTLTQWGRLLNLPVFFIKNRLKKGLTYEEIFQLTFIKRGPYKKIIKK
ncbi:MAG TPA: hypothetical protein VK559_07125 [Ferruginibacter sp.]|nr:hypothetical protein [Ferruginibacter sp.]